MVALRLHAFVIVSTGSLFTWLCPLNAGDSAAVPDMRQLLSTAVRQRFPAALPAVAAPGPHPDPEIVTLPPFLVPAPELRVPAPADTVRPVIGFVRPVSYTAYAAQDQKQQEQMHELLGLADLARISGDTTVADKIRRETYRALVRQPTPLERAMDRSVNGGRY